MKFTERLEAVSRPRARRPADKRPRERGRGGLTRREMTMLRGLGRGKTYKQIALEAGLSTSTVRTHLHNIYDKLGVADRAQAVLKGVAEGLIESDYGFTQPDGLSLFEGTLQGPVIDLVVPDEREAYIKTRREQVPFVAEADRPKPFLMPSLGNGGEAPARHEGALADLLIAMHLKDISGTEPELEEAFTRVMSEDGFDRYGKLIRLAAIALKAAIRVRILGG